MFRSVKRVDGKSLLGKGLLIQTDDVLLHAKSERETLDIRDRFLQVVACHKMAIHPGSKCQLFVKSTTYCGLRITRQGITVDPERTQGLRTMPLPKNLGDGCQFTAAVNWIRDDIPLFSEACGILNQFRVNAMQGSWQEEHVCSKKDIPPSSRLDRQTTTNLGHNQGVIAANNHNIVSRPQ